MKSTLAKAKTMLEQAGYGNMKISEETNAEEAALIHRFGILEAALAEQAQPLG